MTTTTKAATMRVRILGPNLPAAAGETFHVHAAGCADIKRSPLYREATGWDTEADSKVDVVWDIYCDVFGDNHTAGQWDDPAERAPYEQDVRFFPCVVLP